MTKKELRDKYISELEKGTSLTHTEWLEEYVINEKNPVICPNCNEECEPITLSRMCNRCFYDKL